MKFRVQTLIDITETGARRGQDSFQVDQQQNYLTFLQTLGLRANPTVNRSPRVDEIAIKGRGFGSSFEGKQKVWTFEFDVEYEGAVNTQMYIEDFDLIPIISDLDESVVLTAPAFRTKDNKHRNILFTLIDDSE